MSSDNRKWSLLASLPSIAIVAACCGLPLAWLLIVIVANRALWADIHLNSFRADLLARTLGYNFAAALLATAMGLPAGIVLGRGRGWIARAMWFVVPAALFMPSLAFAYGWAELIRSAEKLYRPLGITFFPASPSDILRCIWTLAAWLWAVPACVIGLSLRRMDTSVQQQAVLEGALLRITIRQLLSPLIVSICIVTILATQEFSVYEPTGISVVATEVRMVFDTGAFSSINNPIAATISASGISSPDQAIRAASAIATAVPLLLVTMTLAGLSAWSAGRFAGGDDLAIGPWPRALDAPGWLIALSIVLLLINIVLPIIGLVCRLHVHIDPVIIWEEFSPKVLGSMLIALLAAVVGAIAAGSAVARWPRGMLVLAGSSFLMGGQILAIALIRITNRPWLSWSADCAALPVAAYLARFAWLPLVPSRATWARPWRELREMAALDGASPLRVAMEVIIPLAWPALLAGCIFLGALSLTEVPATVLLSPQNPQVLTPMLMTWVHSAHFDPMIQASLLMVFIVLVPVSVAIPLVWLARFKFQNRARTPRRIAP